MKQIKLIICSAILIAFVLTGCQKEEVISPEDLITKNYIVQLEDNAFNLSGKTESFRENLEIIKYEASKILQEKGFQNDQVTISYAKAFKGFVATLNVDEMKQLKLDGRIAHIEEDKAEASGRGRGNGNGNNGGSGGGDTQPSQITPWGIDRIGGPGDGTGTTVWVLDSGIDLNHPDLNVDQNRSVSALNGGGSNRSADDYYGHGTHVAGTIGAINNDIGVVGVAANATLVSVRILDKNGSGWTSEVLRGIDHVAAYASSGEVANLSIEMGPSDVVDQAIQNAAASGIIFVIAAGNKSADADLYSPSRVNGDNIYTISAMNADDSFASFSNYGPSIDFAAPGVSILSCTKGGNYETNQGTSFAAPHVAGILALQNSINTDGNISADPDGNADPIAHK